MTSYNHILVIEDNPGDARLVATYFDERFGSRCEVRQARTLADGLSVLREFEVDVVVLDLGLPDSQGLEGIVQVQRAAPSTPVVILTGDDDEDRALDALRTGAEDYLSKQDTDGASLLRAIRHAMQRRHLSDRLRESEARFRAIVETAEEGVLQMTQDGQVAYLNGRARTMLGLEDEPTAGAPEGLWFLVHVRAHEVSLARTLLRTAPGDRVSCELQLTTRAGGDLWVAAAAGGVARRPGEAACIVLLLGSSTPYGPVRGHRNRGLEAA